MLGVGGACRGNELLNLSVNDVTDLGDTLLIKINSSKNDIDRHFVIKDTDNSSISYTGLCKSYMALRKPETRHQRFFVRYVNKQCTVQPIGKKHARQNPPKSGRISTTARCIILHRPLLAKNLCIIISGFWCYCICSETAWRMEVGQRSGRLCGKLAE